jgi:hypothetical protein
VANSSTSRTKKKATATRKSSSTAKKSPKTKKSAVKKKPTAAKKPAAAKKATPVKKKISKTASKKKSAGDEVVLVDRRAKSERRKKSEPAAAEVQILQRREKVTRRRQIDPTTCERDYSHEEVEFMAALDEYKRKSGRMFPTCSEILEVIRELGYQKVQKTEVSVIEPQVETPAPLPALPESPVLSLSADFALPADESEAFGF